ncbi:MAG: nucleotidyltransferase family protein [SAR324 cluster bacterium]|nr:nucleotidyltransferase family protein [SAR324 cluster bacterium]
MVNISVDQEAVAQFCRSHHIRKLSLFGSVLRDDFGPESDVDLLVEFDPGKVPGLIRLSGMELDLSPLFGGRKVDLRTAEDLSRYFRDQVVATAEGVYAA